MWVLCKDSGKGGGVGNTTSSMPISPKKSYTSIFCFVASNVLQNKKRVPSLIPTPSSIHALWKFNLNNSSEAFFLHCLQGCSGWLMKRHLMKLEGWVWTCLLSSCMDCAHSVERNSSPLKSCSYLHRWRGHQRVARNHAHCMSYMCLYLHGMAMWRAPSSANDLSANLLKDFCEWYVESSVFTDDLELWNPLILYI